MPDRGRPRQIRGLPGRSPARPPAPGSRRMRAGSILLIVMILGPALGQLAGVVYCGLFLANYHTFFAAPYMHAGAIGVLGVALFLFVLLGWRSLRLPPAAGLFRRFYIMQLAIAFLSLTIGLLQYWPTIGAIADFVYLFASVSVYFIGRLALQSARLDRPEEDERMARTWVGCSMALRRRVAGGLPPVRDDPRRRPVGRPDDHRLAGLPAGVQARLPGDARPGLAARDVAGADEPDDDHGHRPDLPHRHGRRGRGPRRGASPAGDGRARRRPGVLARVGHGQAEPDRDPAGPAGHGDLRVLARLPELGRGPAEPSVLRDGSRPDRAREDVAGPLAPGGRGGRDARHDAGARHRRSWRMPTSAATASTTSTSSRRRSSTGTGSSAWRPTATSGWSAWWRSSGPSVGRAGSRPRAWS